MTLPAAARDDGILGLEGEFVFRSLTMNNRSALTFPRVIVDRITGLHSRADREAASEPKRGQIGEHHYPAAPRGKTVVYEGRVQAQSLVSLRSMERAMRGVFNDPIDAIHTMVHQPPAARGGVSWFYNARIMSLDITDEQTRGPGALPSPWQRLFAASLRMVDPRFFSSDLIVSPLKSTGQSHTVVHEGGAPTDPVIRLHGPLGTTVTISRPGEVLELTGAQLATVGSGETLIVDFMAREARVNDDPAQDLSHLVTFGSTWWDDGKEGVPPLGSHAITVSGGSWEVLFRHADW